MVLELLLRDLPVDVRQQLRRQVSAAADVGAVVGVVANEVREGHALTAADVRIVQVRVQHDDAEGQQVHAVRGGQSAAAALGLGAVLEGRVREGLHHAVDLLRLALVRSIVGSLVRWFVS